MQFRTKNDYQTVLGMERISKSSKPFHDTCVHRELVGITSSFGEEFNRIAFAALINLNKHVGLPCQLDRSGMNQVEPCLV